MVKIYCTNLYRSQFESQLFVRAKVKKQNTVSFENKSSANNYTCLVHAHPMLGFNDIATTVYCNISYNSCILFNLNFSMIVYCIEYFILLIKTNCWSNLKLELYKDNNFR